MFEINMYNTQRSFHHKITFPYANIQSSEKVGVKVHSLHHQDIGSGEKLQKGTSVFLLC
jgi:hypothetical protein